MKYCIPVSEIMESNVITLCLEDSLETAKKLFKLSVHEI